MPELLRSAELALKKNGQDIQQLKKLSDVIIGSLVENLGKVGIHLLVAPPLALACFKKFRAFWSLMFNSCADWQAGESMARTLGRRSVLFCQLCGAWRGSSEFQYL
jgi:hypothetical protein